MTLEISWPKIKEINFFIKDSHEFNFFDIYLLKTHEKCFFNIFETIDPLIQSISLRIYSVGTVEDTEYETYKFVLAGNKCLKIEVEKQFCHNLMFRYKNNLFNLKKFNRSGSIYKSDIEYFYIQVNRF